ncbi:MAG: hypothetical protein ACKO7P_07890 [Bacteroidota bacterium]
MILRILPYLLIIIPSIGFFYSPEPPSSTASGGRQAIADLAYFLFTIPWWGKLLSIIVGISWISSGNKSKETNG